MSALDTISIAIVPGADTFRTAMEKPLMPCPDPEFVWELRSAQETAATHTISVFALVFLLVFAWIVYAYYKDLISIFLHIFHVRSWGKPVRLSAVDGYTDSRRTLVFFLLAWSGLVWLCYALAADTPLASRIAYWADDGMPVSGLVIVTFGMALLMVPLYELFKNACLRFTAKVFEEEKFSAVIIKTALYHDLFFSFVCLPLLACSRTMNPGGRTVMVQILFVLFCILLIYKLFHLILEGVRLTRFSLLHIFVYLCALELALPLCLWRLLFCW